VSEPNQSIANGHAATMEPSPYAIPSRKLAMWLFIISDCLYLRRAALRLRILAHCEPEWPTPFKFFPSILNVVIMTVVLITSSLTMLGAVDASKSGEKSKAFALARRHDGPRRNFRNSPHPGMGRADS